MAGYHTTPFDRVANLNFADLILDDTLTSSWVPNRVKDKYTLSIFTKRLSVVPNHVGSIRPVGFSYFKVIHKLISSIFEAIKKSWEKSTNRHKIPKFQKKDETYKG